MTQTVQNEAAESKAITRSTINDDWLAANVRREGATLSSLQAAFENDYGINVWDDEGDGVFNVELIKDKDFLRGLPFLITRWRFNSSDKYKDQETGEDGSFVSVEIAYQTDPNGPVKTGVFNDGSTGIFAQLQAITKARLENGKADPYAGRGVRKGLRVSVYQIPVIGKDGQPVVKNGVPVTEEAQTYYLDI